MTPAADAAKSSRRALVIFVAAFAGTIVLWAALSRALAPEWGLDTRHWLRKSLATNTFNVVIAGDSRVEQDVDPESMSHHLSSMRILNYGWASAGFDAIFLDAVEDRVSEAAGHRIVVLGITPHSLTEAAAVNNAFKAWHITNPLHRSLRRRSLGLVAFFSPSRPIDLVKAVISTKRVNYAETGWTGIQTSERRYDLTMDTYRRLFEGSAVSPAISQGVLSRVASWRQAGIKVFGFSPPVSTEMTRFEDDVSGFDRVGFAAAFREAGGTWLSFRSDDYDSYDGSHLEVEGARRFSASLGTALAGALK